LAGPAAVIFGSVKEWPSQSEKKFSWANYGWAKFLAGIHIARFLQPNNFGLLENQAIRPAKID
jgi:hypothetical protein